MAVLKDQQNKRNFSRNEHNQNDKRLTNNHQKEIRASAYRNTENARNYSQYEYHPVQGNESANNTLKQEEFILTGRNPIREALKNHRDIEKLLVQKGELSGSAREIVQKAKEQRIQIQVVEKIRLDSIAQNHQGLIAYASAFHYSTVEEILQTAKDRNEEPFLVLLDGVTDPHNLGAVIRTAECAGVHGIIIPQHRSVGLTPSAVKSSAGAVEYVKVAKVNNLGRTIDELKKKNIWFYAVTMNGRDYREISFNGATALVIGSEENGISRLVADKCDFTVSLPMTGKIDSLNASVAAGIIMYKVFEKRS